MVKNTSLSQSKTPNTFSPNRKIIVEKGQSLHLNDEQSFSQDITEVIVHDYAQLTLLYDQKSEAASLHSVYRFELGYKAKVTFFMLLQTSEHCSLSIEVDLKKPESELIVYGFYIVKGQQKVELLVWQNHNAQDTKSNVIIKGILFDEAKTNFNGTIKIVREAKNSKAVLQNKNLVLSPTASAVSKPCLEVLADAVQCKHGSAIASLDDEHLFYLRSRGFSERSAQKSLVEAFMHEILVCIPNKSTKDYWQKRLSTILLEAT